MSESKLATEQLTARIERLDCNVLLPHCMPTDVQVFLARQLARSESDELDQEELNAIRQLMRSWVERLVQAQKPSRIELFRAKGFDLFPQLVGELYDLVCQDLVARIVGYSLPQPKINELFNDVFEEFEARA